VSTSILHVSDLHFGARNGLDEPGLERAIADLVARVDPTLLIASGDLTHRGHRDEHEAAADYLRGLGPPLFVVPGNHDIPLFPPARFTHTWREFERQWETTQPVHSSPALQVVGLNSVRPWRHQSGRVTGGQLDGATRRLQDAQPAALRVVVLHHQLVGAPWRTRKKPVARRGDVLARLVDSGAELILSGHVHQGTVGERHEFEIVTGTAHSVVVATAPGLGRPRPNRRHEARGVFVYITDERQVRVETYIWRGDSWGLTAVRTFPRGSDPLEVIEEEPSRPPRAQSARGAAP
jgi:3',5'-cyclic AMP phosphodiesterase CpdA